MLYSPSMTDDPALTSSVEASRRNSNIARAGYRDARRKRDFKGMLEWAQVAQGMGLTVGGAVHAEDIAKAGGRDYGSMMRMAGASPQPGGLEGFDFRHSRAGGPGVGGYDFRQTRDTGFVDSGPSAIGPNERAEWDSATPAAPQQAMMADWGMGEPGAPPPATAAAPAPTFTRPQAQGASTLRHDAWKRAWDAAPTPEAKMEVLQRSQRFGVPLSDYGRKLLQPQQPVSQTAQPQNPADPAVSTYGTADPAVTTYAGAPSAPLARPYETSDALRSRISSGMAPYRQASADASARLTAATADVDAQKRAMRLRQRAMYLR